MKPEQQHESTRSVKLHVHIRIGYMLISHDNNNNNNIIVYIIFPKQFLMIFYYSFGPVSACRLKLPEVLAYNLKAQ